MPPAHTEQTESVIIPLSFLQIHKSAGSVLDALLERDATVQRWIGTSGALRAISAYAGLPLYFHWFTVGFGALEAERLRGWVFLRGLHQVQYVENLAVSPDARRTGIGTALMQVAESQARALNREWLGLTVTVENGSAVRLYEALGYQRGHWRVMRGQPSQPPAPDAVKDHPSGVELRPLAAPTAETAFRRFAALDLSVSAGSAGQVEARFLSRETYRSWLGQHWQIDVDGEPVGYLHRHGRATHRTIYLAAKPEWWGSPALLYAVQWAVGRPPAAAGPVDIRFASASHHEAACSALHQLGFEEQPSVTMKMFKYLTRDA